MMQPETFQRIGFKTQMLRIAGVYDKMQRTTESTFRTDRDMTIAMMQARMDTLQQELGKLAQTKGETRAPSAGGGSALIDDGNGEPLPYDEARERSLRYQIREFEVEIQKKYSIAIATLVFVLIGVPLALRFPRGGIGMVIAASLLIFSIYYVGLIGGESLADEGLMPPVLAMWQTNLVFGTLGVIALLRAGREQSSGRGGGWGDLPRWLRRPRLGRTRQAVEAS